jgi:hypothetical protein
MNTNEGYHSEAPGQQPIRNTMRKAKHPKDPTQMQDNRKMKDKANRKKSQGLQQNKTTA